MSAAPIKTEAGHTTDAQRLTIIAWLQVPYNFRLITGSAAIGQAVIQGQPLKKTDAYKHLSEYVSQKSNCKWTAKMAKGRCEGYLGKCKTTKAGSEGTGWGVLEADIKYRLERTPNLSSSNRSISMVIFKYSSF